MSPIDDLLDRYLAGDCSPDERAEVERYLAEHPDVAEVLGLYLERLDGAIDRPAPPDTTASWRAVKARLPRRNAVGWTLPAAIAAALIVAALMSRRPIASPERVYTTAAGERSTLHLADGTTVYVAPGSRLRVAAGYGIARREIDLEGEAYFEVAHDRKRPFAVIAGADTARDIGTAYAVRAYSDDRGVRVTVREGRVALSGAGMLRAGDIAQVTNGVARVEHGADIDAALGWIDGRLAYRDTPLGEVLRDASLWYVIDASTDSTLAAVPFTGALTGLSAHEALALVAATTGLKVTWNGSHARLASPHAR